MVMDYYTRVKEARAYPISDMLEMVGSSPKGSGKRRFYSSPFSSDSSPSLCVYPNNTYYDWSNGFGGDSIHLYMKIKNCSFREAVDSLASSSSLDDIEGYITTKYKQSKVTKKEFSKGHYIVTDKNEIELIKEYAEGRGIKSGYYPAKIRDFSSGEGVTKLAVMFLHFDEQLNECGAKFRFIDPGKSRFTARGELKFYILENIIDNHFAEPTIYFVESESSANSLCEIMKKKYINGIVFSMGSQSNKFSEIPERYEKYRNRKIIIDYDGNEEKYEEILKLHKGWGEPIKLLLPKGEDINSLYSSGKYSLVYNCLIS